MNGLQVMGVHDEELHDPEIFRAILREAKIDRGRACVLLAHQPKYLEVPAGEGVALMLCGHTHGGQFWPWIYAARRVHKKFNHGLQCFEQMQVFTSYGAGTWGAPMRVGTKPEIVLIRLEN
jgi:predicted MPP superfamily phosphohydrolase